MIQRKQVKQDTSNESYFLIIITGEKLARGRNRNTLTTLYGYTDRLGPVHEWTNERTPEPLWRQFQWLMFDSS